MFKKLALAVALALAPLAAIRAANELNVTVTANYTKGTDSDNVTGTQVINVTGNARNAQVVQCAPNTTNKINISNIATAGVCFVRNTSATNLAGGVQISSDGTNNLVLLNPGSPALFPLASTNVYLVPNAAAVATHSITFDIKSQ